MLALAVESLESTNHAPMRASTTSASALIDIRRLPASLSALR